MPAHKDTDEDWNKRFQLNDAICQSILALQVSTPLAPRNFAREHPANGTSSRPAGLLASSSAGNSSSSPIPGQLSTDKLPALGWNSRAVVTASPRLRPSSSLASLSAAKTHRAGEGALRAPHLLQHRSLTRPQTPLAGGRGNTESSRAISPTLVVDPIETTGQFLAWYEQIETQLNAKRDQTSMDFKHNLEQMIEHCDILLEHTDTISSALTEMVSLSKQVIAKTREVEEEYQALRVEADELGDMHRALLDRLATYTVLEPIMKLFNAPGHDVCLEPKFIPYLGQIDRSIAAIKTHIQDKDAEFYLMRFQQCRTRGLSLVKHYFTYAMRELGQDVGRAFSGGGEGTESKRREMLYTRFEEKAKVLHPPVAELQRRASQGQEAATIFRDTQKAYLQTRRHWVNMYITESMGVVQQRKTDNSGQAESGEGGAGPAMSMPKILLEWCELILSVCQDERRLYLAFFGMGEDQEDSYNQSNGPSREAFDRLHAYLNDLVDLFYQQVRRTVVHEHDIAVLSGMSHTLAEFMSSRGPPPPEDAESDPVAEMLREALDSILEDTQHRLVFRAEYYIQNEVQNRALSAQEVAELAEWIKSSSGSELSPTDRPTADDDSGSGAD
ncbi:Golgi transport complex subunit 3, partial [Spiromyces aspiralis]